MSNDTGAPSFARPTDATSDDTDAVLARNLRTEREYLGLSQEEVSAVLGIPRPAVSAIENGRRKVSSAELARLAVLFGTSSDRLMGAEPAEESSVTALFRTAKSLTEHDRAQVLRFAEFLREAGTPPPVDPGEG